MHSKDTEKRREEKRRGEERRGEERIVSGVEN
jgi:hypothetical protein